MTILFTQARGQSDGWAGAALDAEPPLLHGPHPGLRQLLRHLPPPHLLNQARRLPPAQV